MFPFFLFNQTKVDNTPVAAGLIAKLILLCLALVIITFGGFYFLIY
jgi:hypothetical protein